MGVVLALMLQLCIIAFAVTAQEFKGSIISPSPAFLPVVPPGEETLGPIYHGEGSKAPNLPSDGDGFVISPSPANLHVYHSPSSPAVPNGPFYKPPKTFPPSTTAPSPQKIKDIEPSKSPSPSTIALSPPYAVVPLPSAVQGNKPPPVKTSPPQREAPTVRPPFSTPTAPAPVAISSDRSPKISPVSQPIEHGHLTPDVDNRNANNSHLAESFSPAPGAVPSANLPKNSSASQPTENGTFPPKEGTNNGHGLEPISPAPVAVNLPKESPVSQPPEHASLPPIVHQRNANMGHNLKPVSPASVAIPPTTYKITSMDSEPTTQHGSIPPNVHKRNSNKGHTSETVSPEPVASPPWKVENSPPETHPIVPTITPSTLTAPVTSPPSAFPLKPPLVHPIVPVASPSKLPAPVSSPTPLRSFNWKKGGAPVVAPLSRNPKPLPAVIHSPAQEAAIPPLLPPRSGQRHHVSPPINSSSSVSPFSSPIHSNTGQVSPAPSPSIKFASHPTGSTIFPPKVAPSESSSKRPKMPLLPQVQVLPPPPPNEDCISTVCTEPYTNSPPGEPCRCVWPMRVGLRLSVSLYTFFPLVSELASEISTGVFMKQSQVRIMGANAADQQPEKTVVLIDLVPLGEEFDNTTAFFTSDRFWHKMVIIKAFYFGDYDVLYVSYPGLPPSPPLPPSSLNMFNGGPYSTDGNNGRTIKPIGVDILKRQQKVGLSRGIISTIAVSVSLAVVLCAAAAWVMFKFRDHVSQSASTPRQLSPPSLTKEPGTAGSLRGAGAGVGSVSTSFRSSIAAYTGSAKTFSTNDIKKATDDFHASRILGEGGFGLVYSGILEDGTKVAVKVLKREDHHGDREFLAEVEMLSRLHHRNLVKLIGICIENSFRSLVYELVPNGSVESYLHGVDRGNSPLDWGARMKIALGAARGLAYLHEDSSPRVIHRDFKSSNILLEDDFTPKVSDFGLARTATDEENKHISTRVMGTFGYVAPEYAMTGHLLVKSDVYSYGVVLLELLTGRKPVDMSQAPGQENLVAWARPLLTSKEGCEAMIDQSLGTDVPFDSVAKVAAIASMCVQPEVSNRPFMSEVVQALKLVCSECDEAKEESGSSSFSLEDLSVDLALGISTVSGQLSDNFQSQLSGTNFDSGVDIERGLAASEIFSSSARFGRAESGSFRRNSYSGPLRTGRSRQLWQIIRSLSSGSVSEHGTMLKL
ncbi:receptor-like serine/threonine-protein kinase ALE2 isoform X7 [Glycine soja]|uniref:Receptor-like serine/threonine-protein kinase ALE2 isoform G n=1 Tax=Glycine soja TaxID=3848 RepID=A0A445HE16_GLYSO|nr:receptor-like serine/threonine-protein kinase ALE2 isoform X7 [Glycine soja]RZB71816.1 Receptor-like serine/threonine-protein kinase ALE2 isoform G [Glycine soja]